MTHLKVAGRMLAARPVLAASRCATVALIVTAATAVFTVANATLLRPLPFPQEDRLLRVYLQPPGTFDIASANPLSPLTFTRLRERTQAFERFEGQWVAERAIGGTGEPESVMSARVTAGFFGMLGGKAVIGRAFSESEVSEDAKVAVISHGLWTTRFGGQAAAVGSTLLVDGQPHTIVGVMAADFNSAFVPSELWTPLYLPAADRRTATFVRTIALLRSGWSRADADRDLDATFRGVLAEAPQELNGWDPNVLDLQTAQFGSTAPALYVLLAAVGALALIATANLANLTIADVMHRRFDFVLRAALGGRRAEIAAPEVAQAVILALVGGIAGIVGARALVPVILSLDPTSQLTSRQLTLDWSVAMCGLLAAMLIMLLAIAVPALRLTGPHLAADLAGGSHRASGGRSAMRIRSALVAAQSALTLVLLSVGAIVVLAYHRSATSHPGFDASQVVTAQLRLPESAYPNAPTRGQFIRQVLERVRSVPGVVNAATTMNPFSAGLSFGTAIHVEDRPSANGQPHLVQFRRISPGYFDTLGIPVLQGRPFDERDDSNAQPAVIVSRSLANRFWPGQEVTAKRIKRGPAATQWSVIVGVVGDVLDVSLGREPADTVYAPVLQDNPTVAPISLVVRTVADPRAFVRSVKTAVWNVDPQQPLANIVLMEQFLDSTLGPQRFRTTLVAVCGILGLLLATIGTYSVTARSVSERGREIGIRLALGEGRGSLIWTMSAASLRAVLLGAAAGVAMSLVAQSALKTLLPELRDAAILLSSVELGLALVVVGAAAAVLAARTATAVTPVSALRAD